MIKPAIFQKQSIDRYNVLSTQYDGRLRSTHSRSVYLPLILISSQMNTEKWNMNIHFHVHQPRSSSKHVLAIHILSVSPSVCYCIKTAERIVIIFFHHTIAHSFQFLPLTHVLLAIASFLVPYVKTYSPQKIHEYSFAKKVETTQCKKERHKDRVNLRIILNKNLAIANRSRVSCINTNNAQHILYQHNSMCC